MRKQPHCLSMCYGDRSCKQSHPEQRRSISQLVSTAVPCVDRQIHDRFSRLVVSANWLPPRIGSDETEREAATFSLPCHDRFSRLVVSANWLPLRIGSDETVRNWSVAATVISKNSDPTRASRNAATPQDEQVGTILAWPNHPGNGLRQRDRNKEVEC